MALTFLRLSRNCIHAFIVGQYSCHIYVYYCGSDIYARKSSNRLAINIAIWICIVITLRIPVRIQDWKNCAEDRGWVGKTFELQ